MEGFYLDQAKADETALTASVSLEGFSIDYRMQKHGTHYDLYVRASDGSEICIPDISRDDGYARFLLKTLSEGAVFPQNITEVMDDLLADAPVFN